MKLHPVIFRKNVVFATSVASLCKTVDKTWIESGWSTQVIDHLNTITHFNSYQTSAILGLLFCMIHSGLIHIRPKMTPYVGERLFRILFAYVSLNSAFTWIQFYLSNLHVDLLLHTSNDLKLVGLGLNFISYFWLNPKVFDLYEVAATKLPTRSHNITGVIRITRHPQTLATFIWSVGHVLLVCSKFNIFTLSIVFMYHVVSTIHYDNTYKDTRDFHEFLNTTSRIPFAAILSKQQKWPLLSEFELFPYVCIFVVALCGLMMDLLVYE